MAYDLEGALKYYTEDEIIEGLSSEQGFDYTGALDSGYSKQEIQKEIVQYEPDDFVSPDPGVEVQSEEIDDGLTGWLSNIGTSLVQGFEATKSGISTAPGVIGQSLGIDVFGKEEAEEMAAQYEREKTYKTFPEERAVSESLSDEIEAFDKAGKWSNNFWGNVGALGDLVFAMGEEVVTNPEGMSYVTAKQMSNMMAPLFGMYTLGKAGAGLGALTGTHHGLCVGTIGGGGVG